MMKKITRPIAVLFAIAAFAASCRKDPPLPPDSSKELKIVGWDSLSKYGGYVNCGVAGTVDANGVSYNFVAPSNNGAVTITYLKFHINVNDGSKPITMFSVWDNYALLRDIPVTGSDIEVKDLKTVIPEGDNGRWMAASLTYSGIGRNGVASGKTVSSVTLLEVRYTDQGGLKKTIRPNLKSPDRMSVYSYMWMNGNYPQWVNGLSVGQNRVFNQAFASAGGDNLLEEIPLKIKAVDCVIGTTPHVSTVIWASDAPFPAANPTPAQVARINDSIVVVKLSTPYLVKKDQTVFIDFYVDVQSITITPATVLRTGIGNLKYYKYKEMSTGIEFSSLNEFYMWPSWFSNLYPNTYLDYYWDLVP